MLVMGFPDIRTALTYAAGIATRLTAILAFFEAGRKFLGSIWRWFQRPWGSSSKTKHRVELKIVPDHGMCQWQEGSIGLEKQAMLVHCKLYLTNVAPVRPYQILDTYIKKPFVRGYIHPRLREKELPLPPEIGDARLANQFEARFTISPPVCESRSVFTCDVVLVDQFGEDHVAKDVEFQPMGAPAWETMRKEERSRRLQEVAERLVERIKNI
jgi:hypothetical protein